MSGSVNYTPPNSGQPQMGFGMPMNRPGQPNRFMQTRPGMGLPGRSSMGQVPMNNAQPGQLPGMPGPGAGNLPGLPGGQMPGTPGIGFGQLPTQADGPPTDLPVYNNSMGGKGGFGPQMGFGMPAGNFGNQQQSFPSAMGLQPGGFGQGSPYQSGAQFSQNT